MMDMKLYEQRVLDYLHNLVSVTADKYEDSITFPIEEIIFGTSKQIAINLMQTLEQKKLFQTGYNDYSGECYIDFNRYDSFDEYYKKFERVEETKEAPLFWLKYDTGSGHLLINDYLIIHSTSMDTDTGHALSFITNRPNSPILREELKDEKVKALEDRSTFLSNLKLKNDFGQLFFPKSLNTNRQVYFRNPIFKKHIEDADFQYFDLRKCLKLQSPKFP